MSRTPQTPSSKDTNETGPVDEKMYATYIPGPATGNLDLTGPSPGSTMGDTITESHPATPEELERGQPVIHSSQNEYIQNTRGIKFNESATFSNTSAHRNEEDVFQDHSSSNYEGMTNNGFRSRQYRAGTAINAENAQNVFSPYACAFVASLSKGRTDEELQQMVLDVFSMFGLCFVKIRRDAKNMPYAFVQFEREADARRAVEEGRGAIIDGRACRTERAKVNRALYLSKMNGDIVFEREARQLLSMYGEIEKVWFSTDTDKEMFNLPEGIWVQFKYFGAYQEAKEGLRESRGYRLDQPNDFYRTIGRSGPYRVNLTRGSNISQNRQAHGEGASIFVGGFLGPVIHDQLFQVFAACGTINSIEIVSKSVSMNAIANIHAFVEFSRREEATRAIAQGAFLNGARLRVERKEAVFNSVMNNQNGRQLDEGREVYIQRAISMGMHPAQIAAIFDTLLGNQGPGPITLANYPWISYTPHQYGGASNIQNMGGFTYQQVPGYSQYVTGYPSYGYPSIDPNYAPAGPSHLTGNDSNGQV